MNVRESFWAKQRDKGQGIESIDTHTAKLLGHYEELMAVYGNQISAKHSLLAKLAAEYHDLGKMNSAFQTYLYSQAGQQPPKEHINLAPYQNLKGRDIPHGLLSAAFIDRQKIYEMGFDEEDYYILVTAVSNHHIRSLDCEEDQSTYIAIVKEDLSKLAKIYGLTFCNFVPITKYNLLRYGSNHHMTLQQWLDYAIVKGLLNKLDYAASAHRDFVERRPVSATALTEQRMKEQGFGFRPCQQYLRERVGQNVALRASTGMGKTEAALLWAGESKTFYTLPYKVSINAIFERIREEGYYERDKCVLLHSDIMSKMIEMGNEEDDYDFSSALRQKIDTIRNLSFPFTVCTVDQLFPFSFRAHGTELIAATLSYSSVIIDEIQAYEPRILARILFGLKLINMMGGKFLLITATLPPFISEYLLSIVSDLEISPPFYTQDLRHVPQLVRGDFDYDDILECGKTSKVLVICNTVAKAQEVYQELVKASANCEVHLLHSRFIRKDRAQKEKDILDFANNKDAVGIWVSTQLVEASLDIDFDVLFTQMSTADSLLQRMGRCYRKRKYTSSQPNIWVFDNADPSVYDKDIYFRSVAKLEKYSGRPMSEEDKQAYIDEVFLTQEIKDTEYYATFAKELNDLEHMLSGELRKDTAQRAFRDIVSDTVIPYKYYHDTKELCCEIEKAKDFLVKSTLENELNKYTVQVNLYAKTRTQSGKIKPKYQVCEDKVGFYSVVLNEYNSETGFVEQSSQGVFVDDD